jgi:AcrR family transcriptional regulator
VAVEPLTVLARALDPAVEPPGDALSERILDATLALAAASGFRHLTIDDVAARAGVGRMTVYRRFGDRARLIDALSVREARRIFTAIDDAAPTDAPIPDQVVTGFVTSMRLAREHPLLQRLASFEPEAVLAAARDGGMFALGRAFLAERLHASQRAGVLARDVEVEFAAELLVRLMASFVLIPETVLPLEDDDRVRELARRVLAPVLGA